MSQFNIPYSIKNNKRKFIDIRFNFDSIKKQLQALVAQEFFDTTRKITVSAAECYISSGGSVNVGSSVISSSATAPCTLIAAVILPDTAVISSITVYWFRNDAAATGDCDLVQADFQENETILGSADSDSSSGAHSVETGITNGEIDNNSYQYFLRIVLDPNDAAGDVKFYGCKITYEMPV